jgi:hypothetical protein
MHGARHTPGGTDWRGGLATPRRNRFFHGKMMDVYQFELETGYAISMRRLLNRLVTGDGVVCGLDVVRGDEPCSIKVTAGVALDGWGREVVVPVETASVPIPPALIDRVCGRDGDGYGGKGGPAQQQDQGAGRRRYERDHDRDHDRDDACVTVMLCYQECESEPVAVLAGDCSTETPCAPGAIREQYRITFEPGCLEPIDISCRFPDVISGGEIDYGELARWITRECPDPPRNPCIALANVRLDCRDDGCDIDDIDIEIRPVVFGNEILFDILSRIVEEGQPGGRWRR